MQLGRRARFASLALLFAAFQVLAALPHVHPRLLRPEVASPERSGSRASACLLCTLTPQASGELVTPSPLGTPEPCVAAPRPSRLLPDPAVLPAGEARSPPGLQPFAAC